METFVQLVVSGIANGFVYGGIALAFVFVFKASRMFNMPGPELATLSAMVAFILMASGVPYIGAAVVAIAVATMISFLLERGIIRAFYAGSEERALVILIGLFMTINGVSTSIWGGTVESFPSPFPSAPIRVAGIHLRAHDLGLIGVMVVILILTYALFAYTKLGLGLRTTASNYTLSQLSGIPVGLMLAVGWAIAGGLAAVAGLMIAPAALLAPDMMINILVYTFAAAILGGLDSLPGAVVGGVIVGIASNMLGTYVPYVGNDLKEAVTVLLITVVLVVRPQGIFGTRQVARV